MTPLLFFFFFFFFFFFINKYVFVLALFESSLLQSSCGGLPPRFRCFTGISLPVFESSLLPWDAGSQFAGDAGDVGWTCGGC